MAWKEVESEGSWSPAEGDKLEGVIASRLTKKGQNEKDYTEFTIETDEGEHIRIWGAVLETKLGQLEDGTKVIITYKGEQRGKNGNRYKDFAVQAWED